MEEGKNPVFSSIMMGQERETEREPCLEIHGYTNCETTRGSGIGELVLLHADRMLWVPHSAKCFVYMCVCVCVHIVLALSACSRYYCCALKKVESTRAPISAPLDILTMVEIPALLLDYRRKRKSSTQ